MRQSLLWLLLLPALTLAQVEEEDRVEVQRSQNPISKTAEAAKYHSSRVIGTPGSVRVKAYQQRLQMERDSFFGNIKWRNVGPEIQGGRVIWIDRPKNHKKDLYVAFATGGLWHTNDMGENWTPLFDNESSFAIGHFALSADGQTIWVGSGENNSQRTSYAGLGVYKSTDKGKTWQHMGLEDTHRTGKILIDPRNTNTVWVGAIGALYSNNPNRGVYKTTDGGKTWQHVLKIDDLTGVIDLVMDPRKPDTVYAAAWERDRRAWNFREGGPGTCVYKTTDGGKNWQKLTNGLPNTGELGRIGLAMAPSNPDTLYAFYDNQSQDEDTIYKDEFVASGILTARRFAMIKDPEVFLKIDRKISGKFLSDFMPRDTDTGAVFKSLEEKKMTLEDVRAKMIERNPNLYTNDIYDAQVFRSDDGGKSWRKTHPGYLGDHMGYYSGRIFVHPTNPDEVLFTGLNMMRSRDGGKTWASITRSTHVDHHAYFFEPTDPDFQIDGNDGGVYFSNNAGTTWRHVNNIPVGQFTTIAVDDKTPYNIFGGLQDNGTMKGPSTYVFGRSNLWSWTEIAGGDGSAIAIDPRNGGDTVFGASQWGAHFGINQATGQRWSARPPGQGLRFQWISPFIVSPHHPDIVYCGSQMLHRSLNQGRTWEALSGDLTTNLPNGDVPYSTLKDISESPFKFGYIIVGTDDGKVWLTKNHGAEWKDVTPPVKGKWVCRVIASKHDPKTLYVAQTGYREDDWTIYLWKSTDEGTTWQSIAGNLPAETMNVIREDPTKKDWLYAGTDLGVFFTTDGGKNWTPLHGNIPRTPVHDIAIQARERELVIASHARSVFVFKLSELDRVLEQSDKDLYIWKPADMTRTNWEYRRKVEYDTTDGNIPFIKVEFFTSTPGEGTVTLKDKDGKTIKEAKGNFLRGYNSTQIDLLLRSNKRYTVDAKGRKIDTAEAALADPFAEERPQFVPAGEYSIEVTVGGKTQTIAWKLI